MSIKPYYDHAGITIYHGDCRNILPELPPVDLVLTDPPYGLNKKMSGGTWGVRYTNGDMLEWDYILEQKDFDEIIKFGNIKIIWGANNYIVPPSRCWLIWIKPQITTLSDIEMAWTNLDQPAKYYKTNRISINKGHPTEKPLNLMRWCMNQSRIEGLVLDPFMGSGTTLVAAKELNRRAIGIEIEEKYCEIAAKRLAQEVFDF
jgi:DNA modification methylase